MSCPCFTELCATDATYALYDHLSVCRRCRAIVARVEQSELAAEPKAASATRTAAPGPAPAPGGVWTFWAPMLDEYIVAAVLGRDETEILIVPLLTETRWASETDVALSPDVLGYEALAPVWAGDHVLLEQAVEAVSVLSEQRLDELTAGYDAFFAGEPVADPAGPPVLSNEDPRIDAQAALADALRPLYSPWAQLQVAEELGPVLAHRRGDVGIDLETWSTRLGLESAVWASFEDATADPYTVIPIAAMGKAVRGLGLIESRRVLELAHASVLAHHVDDSLTAGRAQARRRRGVVPRPRQDPQAAAAAADRYAEALAQELGL